MTADIEELIVRELIRLTRHSRLRWERIISHNAPSTLSAQHRRYEFTLTGQGYYSRTLQATGLDGEEVLHVTGQLLLNLTLSVTEQLTRRAAAQLAAAAESNLLLRPDTSDPTRDRTADVAAALAQATENGAVHWQHLILSSTEIYDHNTGTYHMRLFAETKSPETSSLVIAPHFVLQDDQDTEQLTGKTENNPQVATLAEAVLRNTPRQSPPPPLPTSPGQQLLDSLQN